MVVSNTKKAYRSINPQGLVPVLVHGNRVLACLGGNPGLFECFLIPQVYNAGRYGLDMASFPDIIAIVEHCRGLPAFRRVEPERQPDAMPD